MNKKRDEIKNFNWTVSTYDIDFELFELQLHSLYKSKNIGLNTEHYISELKESIYMENSTDSTAIRLALTSFVKSLEHVLASFGIKLELTWKEILKYGEYELQPRNLVSGQIRTFALDTGSSAKIKFEAGSKKAKILLKKRKIMTQNKDNVILIRNGRHSIKIAPQKVVSKFKLVPFKKLKKDSTEKRKGFSPLFKNQHLTTGAVSNNLLKDLIKFERSVIESITLQFKNEMEQERN